MEPESALGVCKGQSGKLNCYIIKNKELENLITSKTLHFYCLRARVATKKERHTHYSFVFSLAVRRGFVIFLIISQITCVNNSFPHSISFAHTLQYIYIIYLKLDQGENELSLSVSISLVTDLFFISFFYIISCLYIYMS